MGFIRKHETRAAHIEAATESLRLDNIEAAEIVINHDARVERLSHGGGVWVQAWVLVPGTRED